jgi:molybdopterin molybdotransferase
MNESDLISVPEALQIIDSVPVKPRTQRVHLEDAQGRRLAQDVVSDRDYPPFDKSLMDGYAVRCADVTTTPVELTVVGEIAAGLQPARPLGPREAFAIMTGAPIPQGADGVVPVEETVSNDSTTVQVLRAQGPDRFITKRGADCPAGSVVLKRGTKLEAAQLAVAASVGAAEVDVYPTPQAAVLSTGDELVSIGASPGPGQIRNSNNIMLSALLRRFGCDVTELGTARDEPATIRAALKKGLSFDVLFVSGGMSMGRYDFVPKILPELGVELKITKLRIKPGKPFVFGVSGQQAAGSRQHRAGTTGLPAPRSPLPASYVFGLPGNPVSSFVCTMRLCSRLIARMSGTNSLDRWIKATLAAPVAANGVREFYQPAVLEGVNVNPLKWKGSADIYTLAKANALIVRPENSPALEAGQVVDVLEIPS